MRKIIHGGIFIGFALLFSSVAVAQRSAPSTARLPWMYEIRAGYLQPDLDLFSTFYGEDKKSFIGFAAGYRLNDWIEFGAEYGHMRATGVGLLTSSQELGGTVKYTLNPLQIYTNLMLQRNALQRFVPYVGVGLAAAQYEQTVENQSNSEGTTDVGYSIRAGLRVLVGTRRERSRTPWQGYVFLEAGDISTEVGDVDLGGRTYMLGFRMEFAVN